ncbi:rod shape-determining protein MreD [Paenibacillus sp. NPDC058071]|uniref:rod shape-determining protein MreD n=1 Tax=Paenibacillus sp. NPDC058071 TaxID=3346326 RepID=UPI0036D8EC0A
MSSLGLNRLIGIMFLIFIIEGAIMPWLVPAQFSGRLISHFVFVFVMYAALYRGRHQALLLGIGFGLLQDVVFYGHLIGLHGFAMGLLGYFAGLLLEKRRSTLLTALSVIGLGCILYDSMIYFTYSVFRITNESYAWALLDHILPSLFLQLAFALAVYVPARKWFESRSMPLDQEEE